jgi:mannose-6-phosphate isomerase-like protein (cupin superfamily)
MPNSGRCSVLGVLASNGRQRGDRFGVHLSLQDRRCVAAAYSLVEEEFWGETTPVHAHPGAEEAFYLIEGQVELWADGRTTQATSGALIAVPWGVPHGLRRLSDEPVRMLTIVSPPGVERLFAAVAAIGEEKLLADPERLAALATEYGTEILGDYPETR